MPACSSCASGGKRRVSSSSVIACGSSLRLPLVSTIGRFMRRRIRWCTPVLGSMKPSRDSPGATASAIRGAPAGEVGEPLRSSNTIGAAGDCSSAASGSLTWHHVRTASTLAAISANGLRSRRFSARSRATASGCVASQASWYPPRPLIATMWPRASSVPAASQSSRKV